VGVGGEIGLAQEVNSSAAVIRINSSVSKILFFATEISLYSRSIRLPQGALNVTHSSPHCRSCQFE
ncbi:MAG: hypothetical protein Q8O97_02460, partial [bacterium]|nr:hypothetical protein [bacterium]